MQAHADSRHHLRYRCQVACPNTGMTKMRPRHAGVDSITRPPATIKPQTAIGHGFAATARIDVRTAVWVPHVRVEQHRK